MNRIQYELEYTEGISQRMRVPETLKVASDKQTGPLPLDQPLPIHTALMQVPERIVVAGKGSKISTPTCMVTEQGRFSLKQKSKGDFTLCYSVQVTMEILSFLILETWT